MTIKIQGVENMNNQQKLKYVLQLSKGQIETEDDPIALFSNVSAIIKGVLPDLNWAGFYFVKGGELVLGPFQGLPACTRLQGDKGVCAKAWRDKKPVRVDDVDAFPGHVACDSASKSELVVPLVKDGEVIGVLDLDSPILNRFSEEDERCLVELVDILVEKL
ncbi:MAG: GAF domain-containing protein [Tissierellia bacterium]|nr:GAF domain-containing protein [Tissierellia bacterium]